MSFALAIVLWTAPAARPQNRFLAAILLAHGGYFVVYNGLRLFATDPQDAYALMVTGWALSTFSLGLNFAFLSTLDTPLVSWMRRFGLVWVPVGAFTVVTIDILVNPGAWFSGVEPLGAFSGYGAVSTPRRSLYLLATTAIYLLSAIPALHAWRRAKVESARRQAGFLAAVYTTVFVSWAAFIVWYAGTTRDFTAGIVATNFLWQAANSLALTLGLSYGILKAQLFDIDLKIKWTLRRGTLVGVFVAAFFVASAVAQQWLEQYGVIAGGAAVGLLLFAVRPIERAADKLADRAMPRVRDDKGYRTVRKLEVYRAAIDSALSDGDITPKERGMLAALAEHLGVAPMEMHEVERAAREARASPS